MRLKAIRRGLRRALPWLFLATVAALTLYMDVYVARNILDGDTSDIIHVAHLIAETGDPFPTDVYYSTELKLVDSQLLFSLFFHFTQNWTLVRVLGTALMQGLYVLSFLFLCRSARLTWGAAAAAAAFLLLPFSTPYARIVLYHLYYINYLSEAFLMLGLTMRLVECRGWRKCVLPALALAALWVFVGANGVRHMMILGAPMLALAGVWTLSALRRYTWQHGRLVGEPPFFHTEIARLGAVLLGSCVCFLLGYLLYGNVLLNAFSVLDSSVMRFSPVKAANAYTDIFNGWLVAIGARNSRLQLVGVRGLALAAALFSFAYLLWASRASAAKSGGLVPRLMSGMLVSSLAVTVLVFIFDDDKNRFYELYFVPVVAFAFPTLARELDLLKERAVSAGRKLLILLTCACLLFQGGYTCRFLLGDHQLDEWRGLSMNNLRLTETSRMYAELAQSLGYTHALAPYWHANAMMELTDGALTVGPHLLQVEDGRMTCSLYRWGTSRSEFAKENLPPKLLLFVEPDNVEAFEASFPHAPLVYAYEYAGGTGTCVYEITPDDLSYPPDRLE